MLSYFQAIVFGLIQGVTELFPISSLGHSVVLPSALNWSIKQTDPFFLTFLVATHTATAIVLFLFFWKDWKKIISGLLRSIKAREIKNSDHDARLGWLLIIATIPAGVLGLLFEQSLKALFASPRIVAFVLILNGILLFTAERIAKRNINKKQSASGSDERIAKLTWGKTIKIGLMQSLALIPGFSRTGSALIGGLFADLSHEDAARFSFLLATPIIAAASVLKLPELTAPSGSQVLGQILVGSVVAGIASYFSVRFLTRYFEKNKLTPFAIYCVTIGVLLSLLFFLR